MMVKSRVKSDVGFSFVTKNRMAEEKNKAKSVNGLQYNKKMTKVTVSLTHNLTVSLTHVDMRGLQLLSHFCNVQFLLISVLNGRHGFTASDDAATHVLQAT